MKSIKRRDGLNKLPIQVLPKTHIVSRIQLTKIRPCNFCHERGGYVAECDDTLG